METLGARMVPIRVKTLKYLLVIFVLISLLFYYNVLEISLMCSATESGKVLFSPQGGKFVKHRIGGTFRKFANLSKTCGYRGPRVRCPDIRRYGESVLRQTQLATTRMLRIMEVITRRHDINYWLWSGTLLGAVRHQGFIPWDNEADICMLRKDYNKFIRVAASDLPSDILFQNDKTDLEYAKKRQCDAKLRDRTGCFGHCIRTGCRFHDGLQVDIFVFDQDEKGFLRDTFHRNEVHFDDVFPLEEIYFEGYRMSVPKNREKILARKFGSDYMSLPPPNSRCPPGGFIGIPWYSCEEIQNMSVTLRNEVIRESFIINPNTMGLLWYFS